MLMYGNFQNVICENNIYIYNLTSMREGFLRLPALIPPNSLGRFTGRDFDIAYANYILENDLVFKQFFDIIFPLYIGKDVYIIVDESDWSENLLESILKLIQQRYGYNAYKINCLEDYIQAQNSTFISDFNPYYGVQNLDIDKDRYTYIVERERLKNGGKMIYVE